MNILLVEDHNIVRNGIKMLLESEKGFIVVGEAKNGKKALDKINTGEKIDLVLTDINMPEMDGIALVKELRLTNPEIKVVILSMHDHEKYVTHAFMEGADGYILKNVSSEELLFGLKHVYAGGKYLCSELVMKMVENLIRHQQFEYLNEQKIDFSLREIEVLQLIAEGLTNSEMAEKLFISKRTIEGHRQSLLEKTNSKNTATLIRFAVLNGIIK